MKKIQPTSHELIDRGRVLTRKISLHNNIICLVFPQANKRKTVPQKEITHRTGNYMNFF